MRATIVGIVLGLVFAGCSVAPLSPNGYSRVVVPSCAEDEILVGGGDFREGFWENYHCEHPDNL